MSAVIAVPELMAQAATDVASIGSTVNAAHMVAAAPTLSVLPAAADEVSAGIAHLFSGYAQDYQGLAGKAAAFQEQFVQHLTAGAGAYAGAEAVNVALLLQPLTAAAGSIGSAISAFPGQLLDILTSLRDQLVAFLNVLSNIGYLAFVGVSFIGAYLTLLVVLSGFLIPILLLSTPIFGLALVNFLSSFLA